LDNQSLLLVSYVTVLLIDFLVDHARDSLRPVTDEHGVPLVNVPKADRLIQRLIVKTTLYIERYKAIGASVELKGQAVQVGQCIEGELNLFRPSPIPMVKVRQVILLGQRFKHILGLVFHVNALRVVSVVVAHEQGALLLDSVLDGGVPAIYDS